MARSVVWLSLAATAWATPAAATDSWLVAQQGAKPDRMIAVIDANSIRDKTDVAGWMATASPEQIKTVRDSVKLARKRKPSDAPPPYIGPDIIFEAEAELVYEQPLKPDVAGTWYSVNCTRQTIAVTSARILWRHKAMENQAGSPPRPIITTVDRQIAAFVCGMGSDAWRQGPPKEFGFRHLGDIGMQASNFVWPNIWADAARPPFTYTPTQKEVDAAIAGFDANVAKSKEVLARAAAQNAEMGRMADKSGRAGRRQGTIPVMEGWIDHSEAEFVAQWGTPISLVVRADGVRVLTYRWGYVSQLTHPSGAVLSSEDHSCVMNVFAKEVIFDYASEGAGCREY